MWLHLTRKILMIITAAGCFASPACLHVNRFVHEPSMASAQAERFADAALIEHDLNSAYSLFTPEMKKQLAPQQFKDLLAKMHPSTKYPDAVNATDYEPLPGQRGMNIFLFGQTGGERFYYRVYMEGTKEANYAVGGLWRGDGPYPPSNTRHRL